MKKQEITISFTTHQARVVLGEMMRIEDESESANYRLVANQICNRLRRALGITRRRHKTLGELDGREP